MYIVPISGKLKQHMAAMQAAVLDLITKMFDMYNRIRIEDQLVSDNL